MAWVEMVEYTVDEYFRSGTHIWSLHLNGHLGCPEAVRIFSPSDAAMLCRALLPDTQLFLTMKRDPQITVSSPEYRY